MLSLIFALLLAVSQSSVAAEELKPIMLEKSGGFTVGGKVLTQPGTDQTLSCDHRYMEYFIPWKQRKTSIVMWHSSSTQSFQNRWDGGEGYKDMFLRRDYPVYLWDAPGVGRANWLCKAYNYWPDVQFPTENEEAWQQATSGRYVEFDTVENVHLQSDEAAVAADSGRLGDSVVYFTNSMSSLRTMLTAIKSESNNIKAIVNYEPFGHVFPDNANITEGDAFGSFIVPLEDIKKLAKLPAIQFVWGAHREGFNFVNESLIAAEFINKYGGNAEVVMLADDHGLEGSTHIAFADMDNAKVAGLVDRLFEKTGLDEYP
ncbi:hypothetical protein AJ80_05593 [Polytolypa hystricis UAMH7299]|uniref:AB hydrolase-1 domain-containing protein n=1 Tax=Polytolypa hystricis (strain UAMH7299) TaxID=1447883 RepID=A0A2B7Y1T3_POLH7|nr:hypothetical protein AJ80_05593 [Polytolypa hystricis UAMH7299]